MGVYQCLGGVKFIWETHRKKLPFCCATHGVLLQKSETLWSYFIFTLLETVLQ